MTDHDNTPPRPPIDFDALALPQNYDALLHTEKVLVSVPLRKPLKQDWVRTHREWAQSAFCLRLQGEMKRDDLYLLAPTLVPVVPPGLVAAMRFIPTITRQQVVAMWPLRMPNATNGRADAWATSALAIAGVAREKWVQLRSNMGAGCYEYTELKDLTDEPVWPPTPWLTLRELAFKDRVIDDLDHPVLRQVLRGR